MKMKNKIGPNLNAPKISKSDEEFSQPERGVMNKKRKQEFKNSKKVKRMKHEPEFGIVEGSLLNEEEHILEASSKETHDENLVSKDPFQNMEESCNSESMKKKKKMNKTMKNFCNTFKAKQYMETCWQEEKSFSKGNSIGNKNLAFDCSQDKSFNSAEESKYIAEEEVMSRQRKKEKKGYKKVKEGVGDAKSSSISESDDVEQKSAEESITESIKIEKQSPKDSKRHRNKTSNLKSCLKSCLINNKYSFKQKRSVSFCENVSYKVIENVVSHLNSEALEANEKLLSCNDEDGIDREVLHEIECIEMNHVDDSVNSDNSTKDDEYNDVSCDEVEDNTVPECFKLPKCSSTNYDSWLETQRIAARMKVYKNMVKRMKKHPILRKTNLLEIKGYGNWGL
ncbi:hypothetical protein HNY73_004960 [Argiope bruennichi]|uniref:Uncharacterized protein n=1 Tax=Argiope bruennichi TaxID=94029 RepID=A0A8T0FRN5_ARGBR|nr:hypothetical protein HNY73_004960 [Argiope bruennichi]